MGRDEGEKPLRDCNRDDEEKERNTASVFDISVLLTLGLKDWNFIALEKLEVTGGALRR